MIRKKNGTLDSPFEKNLKAITYEWGPIIIILLGALALRLVLFTGIVRNDDLDYMHLAQDVVLRQFGPAHVLTQPFSSADWRFGLYLPVAILYGLFGPSELTSILFPLLASLAGIFFIYLIGRQFAGVTAGLISAFLWALFPLDIHLATELMPDGPMTAFSIASVYFFIAAQWGKKSNLTLFWSVFFLLWAIFVKQYALVTALFLVVNMALIAISKHYSRLSVDQKRTFSKISITLLVIVILGYVAIQRFPFQLQVLRSSQDVLELFFGVRPNRFGIGQRNLLSVGLTPLFFIATAFFGAKRKHLFLLSWAIFNYAFIEWGPTRSVLDYTPTVPLAETRNLTMVFVPLILLGGTFITEQLQKPILTRTVLLLSLLTPSFALWAKREDFSGFPGELISIGLVIAILGAFGLLRMSTLKEGAFKAAFTVTFLCGLALAMINPTPPDHFTEPRFANQIAMQQGMRPIVEYLRTHDEYPIVTFSDDLSLNLNYVSNLAFGFNQNSEVIEGIYRIEIDQNAHQRTDSFYAVFYTDYRGPVPIKWWKVMQINLHEESSIFLYRSLSSEDAKTELAQSIERADLSPSAQAYAELFGAAQNAANLPFMLHSWALLQDDPIHSISLEVLALVTKHAIEDNPDYLKDNILGLANEVDWIFVDPVNVVFNTTGLELEIKTPERLAKFQGISKPILLKSNTLYYFEAYLESDIPVRILNLSDGAIPDSHDFATYGYSNKVFSIFITPDWPEAARIVDIEFVSGREAGWIKVIEPALYEVMSIQESR